MGDKPAHCFFDMVHPDDHDRGILAAIGVGIFHVDARFTKDVCNLEKTARLVLHFHCNYIGKCDVIPERGQFFGTPCQGG